MGDHFLVADDLRHDVGNLTPVSMKVVQVADGAPRLPLFLLGSWTSKISVCSQRKSRVNHFVEYFRDRIWARGIGVLICWIHLQEFVRRVPLEIESGVLIQINSVDTMLGAGIGLFVRRRIIIKRGKVIRKDESRSSGH